MDRPLVTLATRAAILLLAWFAIVPARLEAAGVQAPAGAGASALLELNRVPATAPHAGGAVARGRGRPPREPRDARRHGRREPGRAARGGRHPAGPGGSTGARGRGSGPRTTSPIGGQTRDWGRRGRGRARGRFR